MAHFCSYPKMERITEVTIPNSQEITIGLWGFKDFEGNELELLAPPYVKAQRGDIKGDVRIIKLFGYNTGRWSLSAMTKGGAIWDTITVFIKAPSGVPATGGKYTDNPNEVVTKQTKPSARDVVNMLSSAWPQLTDQGARTLTAQFMFETGEGQYCFNWNLGNVKASGSEKHMYLRHVWECFSSANAQNAVASSNGLAHLATAEEIRIHGWKCGGNTVTVVFEPPHYQCRFRAYDSLTEGAQRWVSHHQGIARAKADYVTNLNAGNIAAVAHTLKEVQYYSGGEPDYVTGMTGKKAKIDRELGAP